MLLSAVLSARPMAAPPAAIRGEDGETGPAHLPGVAVVLLAVGGPTTRHGSQVTAKDAWDRAGRKYGESTLGAVLTVGSVKIAAGCTRLPSGCLRRRRARRLAGWRACDDSGHRCVAQTRFGEFRLRRERSSAQRGYLGWNQ